MASPPGHSILIVDDEPRVGRALARLIKKMGVSSVYAESGKAGLQEIQKASVPFSLILSDQRMPGMEGSAFLEKAKFLSPDTIRFLLTGYADADAVTRAVNKGSIHRYITKPWDNEALTQALKSGLAQYELILENERLFKLAKTQNARLYAMNQALKKSSTVHKKTLAHLDKEIEQLEKQLEIGFENRNYLNEIEALLKENNITRAADASQVYGAVTARLFRQFQDIAIRNGFELTDDR